MPKYFSLEEANALLPRLEPLVRRLQMLKRQFDECQERLTAWGWKARGNGRAHDDGEMEAVRREAERLSRALQQQVAEVQAFGCEVKDLDMGLLDFPTVRDGRVVYLCWRLGEPRIAYWHELDAGFAGRQPLE